MSELDDILANKFNETENIKRASFSYMNFSVDLVTSEKNIGIYDLYALSLILFKEVKQVNKYENRDIF